MSSLDCKSTLLSLGHGTEPGTWEELTKQVEEAARVKNLIQDYTKISSSVLPESLPQERKTLYQCFNNNG